MTRFIQKRRFVSSLVLIGLIGSTQSAHAALTIGATSISTDGAYTLNGVAGSVYSIGAATTTGTITIGGTAQTGDLVLGSSTGTNSVKIANGSGATTLNLANVQTGGAVNIGGAMTTGVITIGNVAHVGAGGFAAGTTINSGATTATAVGINAASLTTGTGVSIVGGSAMANGGTLLSLSGASMNPVTFVHTANNSTGNVVNINVRDSSTGAGSTTLTQGLSIETTLNTSGTSTKAVNGIAIESPTLTGCAAGACTWTGAQIRTQGDGAANTITQYGILVESEPVALGAVSGIYVRNLTDTAGAGTEIGVDIGSGWDYGLQVGSPVVFSPQAVTIADDGNGATAATSTLLPTRSFVEVTCNDANGCDITMSKASPIIGGQMVTIINRSANTVNFADSPNTTELAGGFAAGQYDSIQMIYSVERWVEVARSNN